MPQVFSPALVGKKILILGLGYLPVKMECSNFSVVPLKVSEVKVVLESLLLTREPERVQENTRLLAVRQIFLIRRSETPTMM